MRRSKNKACQLLAIALILLQSAGCAKRLAAPPVDAYQGILENDSNRLQESLFKADQEVLSNQDIERILSARLSLADRHRVAVLGLNSRTAWSQELADLETQNSERFLQTLRSATQLTQVRFMPSLLVPEKRTVPISVKLRPGSRQTYSLSTPRECRPFAKIASSVLMR